jgi:glycosyltransferase involved in cell wall biosynthesis
MTIGVPVYNGEQYLAESLEALVGQTYEDFELIISDNASTDGTEAICRRYARADSRVRYLRQPRNKGCAANHNVLVNAARGELFKWAMDDDLYARDLLERCVAALDEYPNVVAAHSWTGLVDGAGAVTQAVRYPLDTASAHAPDRFRSLLFASGGDDDGAVIRTNVLRRCAPLDSYHHADRTIVSELALHGPFYQVPDWLYFRRDHPDRIERASPGVRSRCTSYDPRRADRWRHPTVRLLVEYALGYVAAIRRAPLSPTDKLQCCRYLAEWMTSRATGRRWGQAASQPRAAVDLEAFNLGSLVAGQDRHA